MSNILVGLASKVKTGSSRKKLLLLALADAASEYAIAEINYEKLAGFCECDESDVDSDIDDLRAMRLIAVVRRFGYGQRDAYIFITPDMMPGSLTRIMHGEGLNHGNSSLVEFNWGSGATESSYGVKWE